jgi:hypothetical protein
MTWFIFNYNNIHSITDYLFLTILSYHEGQVVWNKSKNNKNTTNKWDIAFVQQWGYLRPFLIIPVFHITNHLHITNQLNTDRII